MAKRKLLTPEKIEQLRNEGRGEGTLSTYIPWLFVWDVPSFAKQSRPIKGWKTGRTHHLLSPLEHKIFLYLQWLAKVYDIREQFPLHPWRETVEIAQLFGVKFPRDPKTKQAMVMTTDFVVTLHTSQGDYDIAIAVKGSDALKHPRTVEKLLIEAEYWRRRNVTWYIMTEKHLPSILVKNLLWTAFFYFIEDLQIDPALIELVTFELTKRVIRSGSALDDIAEQCDADLGIQTGTSITVARHLIATQFWDVDMYSPLGPSKPIILRNASRLY